MLHSRKHLGEKNKYVSAGETIGLTACSTMLILNAINPIPNADVISYTLRGYCLLDSIFHLFDGTSNILGRNIQYLALWQLILGIFGSMVAISLGIGISSDVHGVCNWSAAKDFFDVIISLVSTTGFSYLNIQSVSILKSLFTACGWFFLQAYGLTNFAGCFFMSAAALVSVKENICLFTTPALPPINLGQLWQDASQQDGGDVGARPFEPFSGPSYRISS